MKRMCATPYLRLNTVLSTVPDSILYRCTESSSHAVTSRSSCRWKSSELMELVFSYSTGRNETAINVLMSACLIMHGGKRGRPAHLEHAAHAKRFDNTVLQLDAHHGGKATTNSRRHSGPLPSDHLLEYLASRTCTCIRSNQSVIRLRREAQGIAARYGLN